MKHVLALTAIAGTSLLSSCAPRPESQGAAFDPNISAQEPPMADESGLRYSPEHRSLGPHTRPGNSSEGILPDEGSSDESNPEFMLPRHKNEVYSI